MIIVFNKLNVIIMNVKNCLMRRYLFFVIIALNLSACNGTSEDEIFADVISYNSAILKLNVTNCKIIDRDASCAGKSTSVIVSCTGSDHWYKWDKTQNYTHVYTIPANADNYRCNPGLNYMSKFKAHCKSNTSWISEDYSD